MDAPQDQAVQALAVAVIHQAVRDLDNQHLPAQTREEARHFLEGGPLLRLLWAPLAGIDADQVRRRILGSPPGLVPPAE